MFPLVKIVIIIPILLTLCHSLTLENSLDPYSALPHLRHRRAIKNLRTAGTWDARIFDAILTIPIDECFDPLNFDNKSGTVTTCATIGQTLTVTFPQ